MEEVKKNNCSLHNGNILSLLMGAQKGASKNMNYTTLRSHQQTRRRGWAAECIIRPYLLSSFIQNSINGLTHRTLFHGWLLYVLAFIWYSLTLLEIETHFFPRDKKSQYHLPFNKPGSWPQFWREKKTSGSANLAHCALAEL